MKLPQYNIFLQCINSAFTVSSNAGINASLVLKTVSPIGAAPANATAPVPPAFSLIFEGDIQNFLPQGTHIFQHAQCEEMAIFIVPIGPDGSRSQMRYEAIFN